MHARLELYANSANISDPQVHTHTHTQNTATTTTTPTTENTLENVGDLDATSPSPEERTTFICI